MNDDALSRLEIVVDEIAQSNGAGVQSAELPDGSWSVSIEPTGDAQGDWAVSSEGPTRAKALSNLIAEAKAQGIA